MSNPSRNEDFYRFRIGQFECVSVSDGYYEYDPGHLFVGLKDAQFSALLKSYDLPTDRIVSPYSFLYVDTGKHKVLADMGAGTLGPHTGNMVKNLKIAGIQPRDIDTIVITHAHPDHIGGTLDAKGKPNFPNALYYLWKDEWDFWFSEEAFSKVEEHLSGVLPTEVFMKIAHEQLLPIRERITLLLEESEIVPGVFSHKAYGHTPGHMVVSFSSAGEELFFTSDTVVFPFLLERLDLVPVFDMNPDMANVSKHRIFNLAAERHALVHAQHFMPFPSLGHVLKKERGWQWIPLSPDN